MKSKLTKILWNPIAGITYGLIANTEFGMAMYSLKIRDVIPIINRTQITVDSLQNDVNEIKSCYLKKDVEGREVKVSINNNLEGNNVSVFKDNKLGLKFTQVVFLTNPIDFNDFAPTIKLIVTREVDRSQDNSEAEIFISKDAASRLGLVRNISQGVFTLKIKLLDDEN